MTIYLDFDGTMVEHAYPTMGRFNPHALAVVKKLQEKGHIIILNTYRSNTNDGTLGMALDYLHFHPKIKLRLIQSTKEKLFPPPFLHKDYKVAIYKNADKTEYIFIDDMQVGIPLMPAKQTNTYMVDWITTEKLLMEANIL